MRSQIASPLILALAVVPIAHAQPPDLLTITPPVVALPATAVGSSSYVYFPNLSILNSGTAPVTITSITIGGRNASDYTIDASGCPLAPSSLAPGEGCEATVTFVPTAVGLRLATVVVTDVGGSTQGVAVDGQGLAPIFAVSLTPQVVFPDTPVGLTVPYAPEAFVNVSSVGNVPITLQSVTIAGADAADFQIVSNTCSPGPTYGCSLCIAFSPSTTGPIQATLQVTDNAPGGVQLVPLIGIGGAAEHLLQFFPAAIAFAPTGSANPESTQLTVSNVGSTPVTINGLSVEGPNSSDFTLMSNYCRPIPYTLSVFTQCTVDVLFNPSAVGARFANLRIADSATGSPQTIPLEGSGVPANIDLVFSLSPIDLGPSILGVPFVGSVDLENPGAGSAQVTFQVTGHDAADFSVPPDSCPNPVTSSASCYFAVTFTPSAPGMRTAMLTATDSTSGRSQSVLMVGAGEPTVTPLSSGQPSFNSEAVGTTSPPASVYVCNSSGSPVTITGVYLSGADFSNFTLYQNNCAPGTVVPPGIYCSLLITFTPSAVGPRLASLVMTYSGQPSAFVVPLAGLGIPSSRQVGFNSTSLDLGPQSLGSSITSTAGIVNTGTEAVTISGLSIAGADAADFAVVGSQCPQSPATLPAGSICQVTLQFAPSALGDRLAHLQVSDNATGSPQSLPLAGFGNNSAPSLGVAPNALSFGPQSLGTPSQQIIELTADSFASVSLTGMRIGGANAGDYTMVSSCPPVLTYNTFCNIDVTFTPSVTGLRLAYLEIQDNAMGNPQVVPLAGMSIQSIPSLSISFDIIPVTFQPQGIGYTTTATVNLQNTGTGNILFTGLQITGRNRGDYAIQSNTCPLSPAPFTPYGQCQITIAFTPIATGLRIATLKLSDNIPGSPQAFGIVGEGVPAVKTLQVTPSTVTFSPTPVGTTVEGAAVTVLNSGTAPVTLSSFDIIGANAGDFGFFYTFCTLPVLNPGAFCQLAPSFTPSATGARTAAINIASDATGSPAVVQLTGTGE